MFLMKSQRVFYFLKMKMEIYTNACFEFARSFFHPKCFHFVHIVPGFFHDLIKHVRPFNVYYTCEHEFKLMIALILHFFFL